MADISITASSVVPGSNAVIASGTAGETITAGQTVYADATASNKLKKAANTSATTANVVGVALNGASADQPIDYIVSGDLTLNAALTAATCYVLGSGAGGISASADLDGSTNTRYGTVLGISSSTTNLKVGIVASGVLNP